MPSDREQIQKKFEALGQRFQSTDEMTKQLKSDAADLPPGVPKTLTWSRAERDQRLDAIRAQKPTASFDYLTHQKTLTEFESLRGNIENFIGFTQVPTGVAGPVRIHGLDAKGEFYLPLSTSEGALVASISRGCQAINAGGGARSVVVMESVSRAPVFVFENLIEAGLFCQWAANHFDRFSEIASLTTRNGKLTNLNSTLIGNHAHLIFSYSTGDASGQNMVTIATEAILRYIHENSPYPPRYSFIEGNMSGDKKPTAISFLSTRGKKVISEVEIPRDLFEKILHTTPENVFNYWKTSFVGGVQSGSIGVQGHYANALAALFLACGQDVACVGESCVGITVCDVMENGNFYISVTLPNLIVGTVGGGTGLPTQKECLQLLGCEGTGTARKFAEICAAAVLAGEISIMGALAAGHFSKAHQVLGRKASSVGPRLN
jgi:hydroxymethylglutaryl-CoA reductase (NADPH)